MALSNSGRGILSLSLLLLIVLVGELAASDGWAEFFRWDERAPELNDIFVPSRSSAATAAGQADHPQLSWADQSYPVGLPAGPSASHHTLISLPDYYLAQPAAEAHPAESLAHWRDMPLEFHEIFGTEFGDTRGIDYPLGHLTDGTQGPDGLAAAETSQADYGVLHVFDSPSHTVAGPGPSCVPAVSKDAFPPVSDTTSGPNQRVKPGKKSLKPRVKVGEKSLKPRVKPAKKSLKPKVKSKKNILQLETPLAMRPLLPPRRDSLFIPLPHSQRPKLSRKLPPQGGL
ncbi:hypothetical protein PTTG_07733, partial [Puccinia triticina 1-1 BBBD Race 1]